MPHIISFIEYCDIFAHRILMVTMNANVITINTVTPINYACKNYSKLMLYNT